MLDQSSIEFATTAARATPGPAVMGPGNLFTARAIVFAETLVQESVDVAGATKAQAEYRAQLVAQLAQGRRLLLADAVVEARKLPHWRF